MKNQILFKIILFLFCSLVSTGKIFPQLNQWVWIKGDSSINQRGVYGLVGMSSVSNKPGARGESASWKDMSGNFWMFGGIGYGTGNSAGPLNDLWKYNPSANEWTWVKGPQLPSGNAVYGTKGIASAANIPGARQMSSTWTDTNGNLWLFGGSGASFFNDLWKYDIVSNQWTWVNGDNTGNVRAVYGTQGVAAAANKPGARTNAVCWTDHSGNLWLFGGNGFAASGNGGRLNDLWKYNVAANEWTWMKGDSLIQSTAVYGNKNVAAATNKPGARVGASSWTDQSGNLWLFGGLGYTSLYGMLNDLWKYNTSANEWVWINGDSTVAHPAVYGNNSLLYEPAKPGALHNAVSWTGANGDMWLFGGRGYTASAFGELNALWKYNAASNQWIFVKGDPQTYVAGDYGSLGVPAMTNKPGSREKPLAWIDSLGNIWMFGGEYYPLNTTATSYHNDLWKFALADLLPVHIISFEGTIQDQNILLQWKVENEMNFERYEIERSYNGADFSQTGSIHATNRQQYDFADVKVKTTSDKVYYRLKLIDTDGKSAYSKVIVFSISTENNFVIYPNPAREYARVRFDKTINAKVQVAINDANGRLIEKKQILVNGTSFSIPVNKLSAGNYILTLKYDGNSIKQKLIISR